MLSRLGYRLRQFWLALRLSPKNVSVETVRDFLTPGQMQLFLRMHPAEQAHACAVFQYLLSNGYTNPDLLTAALLHDVGKVRHPLSLWMRVVIVLGERFFPRLARRWGQGEPGGLRLPFVVSLHHPAWGADLVAETGASKLAVELIRHHHDTAADERLVMLRHLQEADEKM